MQDLARQTESWTATLEHARAANAPPPVIDRIDETLAAIRDTRRDVEAYRAQILALQDRVARQIATCDEAIDRITSFRKKEVGQIFARDSLPLLRGLFAERTSDGTGAAIRDALRDELLASAGVRGARRTGAARPARAVLRAVLDLPSSAEARSDLGRERPRPRARDAHLRLSLLVRRDRHQLDRLLALSVGARPGLAAERRDRPDPGHAHPELDDPAAPAPGGLRARLLLPARPGARSGRIGATARADHPAVRDGDGDRHPAVDAAPRRSRGGGGERRLAGVLDAPHRGSRDARDVRRRAGRGSARLHASRASGGRWSAGRRLPGDRPVRRGARARRAGRLRAAGAAAAPAAHGPAPPSADPGAGVACAALDRRPGLDRGRALPGPAPRHGSRAHRRHPDEDARLRCDQRDAR